MDRCTPVEVPLGVARGRRLAAAVLAGGHATRYGGRAKGLLALPAGGRVVDRILAALAAAEPEETVLSANDPDWCGSLGLTRVPDERPGDGPLGGIAAVLRYFAGRDLGVLLLPCDLPGITAEVTTRLAAAYRAGTAPVVVAALPDGRWEPLCAVVHNARLPEVAAAAQARRGVAELWRALGAVPVTFADPAPFFNVNTPTEFAAWCATPAACHPAPRVVRVAAGGY